MSLVRIAYAVVAVPVVPVKQSPPGVFSGDKTTEEGTTSGQPVLMTTFCRDTFEYTQLFPWNVDWVAFHRLPLVASPGETPVQRLQRTPSSTITITSTTHTEEGLRGMELERIGEL